MARMFPSTGPADDTESGAERQLFDLFSRELDDAYRVIHSTNWHATDERGRVADGEADFVIIHPEHGVLILEVKGGIVELDGKTKRWMRTVGQNAVPGKAKREPLPKDPFKQAMKSMHVLVRTLHSAPETQPFASGYRLGYGAWFPHTHLPQPRVGALQGYDELILDAHDRLQPEQALLRLYQHFAGATPPLPLSEQAIDALMNLLSPTIVPVHTLAIQIAGEEAHIKQLTEAQYERLQAMWRVQRQLAVPGSAGTGKTVLAREMAWRLAGEGLDVLLLCANPYLVDWLTYRMERDPRPVKPHVDVHSIKSLVAMFAKVGGLRQAEVPPLQVTSAANQKTMSSILTANLRELERRGAPMPYDAVLVDEAQDIEQAMWTPIQKLLRDRTDGFFYIFYDEAQRVDLPGKFTFRPAGGRVYFPLTANCRNTRPIFELMTRLNPALAAEPFNGPSGRPVEYLAPPSQDGSKVQHGPESEVSALGQALNRLLGEDGGLKPEDVLVISCRPQTKSRWYGAEARVVNGYTLRWLRQGERDGCVPLTTIRSAKGLEFKAVILAELNGLDNEEHRYGLLYLAVSRAMHHLVVLGSERDLFGPQASLWGRRN